MSRASDYANSVSSLYAQIGEARGREAANKGAIWSGALANIGDFVSQYPERKAKMEEIKNRAAMTDLEKQRLQHQIEQDKAEQEADDRLRELFARSQQEFEASQSPALQTQPSPDLTRGPDDSGQVMPGGLVQEGPKPNLLREIGATIASGRGPLPIQTRTSPLPSPSEILRAVGPKKAIPIINGLAALKQDPQGDPEKSLKLLQQVANGLNALPEDMRAAAYPDIVKSFEQRGILKPGALPPTYDPTHWKFIMGTGQEPPKPKEPELVAQPGPNGPVYGPKVAGAPVYEKPGAAAGDAKVGSFEDFVTRKYGANPTPEQVLAARKAYGQADDRPAVTVNMAGDDVNAIADAIIRGDQPPELNGLYRNAGPVRAALARKGYDQSTALTDWRATQKHVATLNGAQQTRMAQAIDNAAHSLDVIEGLADQWDGGKFPPLNKARLALAKNGALGAKAQQIATNLEAQISDVTSELGNVYMGGNSPTDHALGLAAKNLSADWTKEQLRSALKLARTNLQIRTNSMRNVGVAGASAGNPYAAPSAPTVAPPTGRYNPKTGKVE